MSTLGIRPYERGLNDLGGGNWAWLQPDGSWGWSNAGLVVDGEETLLVDTLFDLPLTREMLRAMRDAVPAAREIGRLVNTHSNGDHCNGNELLAGAEIIASAACAEEMVHESPEGMVAMKQRAAGAISASSSCTASEPSSSRASAGRCRRGPSRTPSRSRSATRPWSS